MLGKMCAGFWVEFPHLSDVEYLCLYCTCLFRGEGFAVVIAKPLSKALEDRDNIECIVRETGVNQDGRTKGITMPSTVAQASLIRAVYAKAGLDLSVDSDRPQYFEAHGTGSSCCFHRLMTDLKTDRIERHPYRRSPRSTGYQGCIL